MKIYHIVFFLALGVSIEIPLTAAQLPPALPPSSPPQQNIAKPLPKLDYYEMLADEKIANFDAEALRAETVRPGPNIPLPLVPQEACGRYLPSVRNYAKFLKNKKVDFYEESIKSNRPIYADLRKSDGTIHRTTKELCAAFEWATYYRLAAPLKSLVHVDQNVNESCGDIILKVFLLKWLCRDNVSETARLLEKSEKEVLRHRVETITTMLAYFKRMEKYASDRATHEKEDAGLMKLEGAVESVYIEKAKARARGGPIVIMPSSKGREISYRLHCRNERRRAMLREIESCFSWNPFGCIEPYFRKLMQCFPGQAGTVHSYMKKTGFFPTDLECAYQLQHRIKRSPETNWVFQGFPSAEKVDKMKKEQIDKSNAEITRRAEAWKREQARQEQEARRRIEQTNPALQHPEVKKLIEAAREAGDKGDYREMSERMRIAREAANKLQPNPLPSNALGYFVRLNHAAASKAREEKLRRSEK